MKKPVPSASLGLFPWPAKLKKLLLPFEDSRLPFKQERQRTLFKIAVVERVPLGPLEGAIGQRTILAPG
jgi:hypothetical protein